MTQLLLETATDVCSVAVARDGVILAEHTGDAPHLHSSHLTVFIQQVLALAQVQMPEVEEIVLSDGPGSYTSLRVGAATAKGLCMAILGLKLRAVSSLAALAISSSVEGPVLATINSRRGQVYAQLFRGVAEGSVIPLLPLPGTPGEFASPHNLILDRQHALAQYLNEVRGDTGALTIVGPGQERVKQYLVAGEYGTQVTIRFAAPQHCSASLLLAPASAPRVSRAVDVASYEPHYLNPPFVTKSKKKPLG